MGKAEIMILKKLSVFFLVAMILLVIGSTFVIDAEAASIVVPVRYEQGRYTVANGGAVASTINIRSSDFLEVRGCIQLYIPSQYSVTLHQYRGNNVRTYIDCLTGLSGTTSIDLNQETNYVRLSVKKRNNSVIQPYEGENIKLYRYVADSEPDPIDNGEWESGRYAVGNGKPIASDVNIRSKDFIAASNNTVSLQIPSGFTVTVHEYSSRSDSGFIKSTSGLQGNTSVNLTTIAHYVKFSFKRTNNSAISITDGDKLQYTFTNTHDADPEPQPIDNSEWESGRYAVGNGKPIASDVNIRSKDFIAASNNTVSLQIPSGFTVTVHEYSSRSDSGFIKSTSDLQGNTSVNLTTIAHYVKFSFKRTNNSAISITDGDKLQYTFTNTHDAEICKAMLTIIDDDGDIKYYTDIYPLAKAKNVSISTAVPASFIGKTNYLTWEMISEIRGSGMEVLCHTYGHPLSTKIDGMTEDDFRSDYSRAKEIFNAHGINADLLVFSGSTGLYSKAQIPAQEIFKGAFLAGDNKTNQVGTNPYNIKRYRIGSNYAWNVQVLEGLIDSLKETGGWMVWMMHTSDKANYTSNVPSVLGEVIDYCKEQGISIVTAEYGFSQYCN